MAWLEKHGKIWKVCYRDRRGRVKRVKGYTDRGATKQLAARMERNSARGAEGLIDPFASQRKSSLTLGDGTMERSSARFVCRRADEPNGHFEDYADYLRSLNRSASYIRNSYYRLRKLAEECDWQILDDITDIDFNTWRTQIPSREDGKPTIAPKTQNHYLDTLTAFCIWCVGSRLASNPVANLMNVDVTGDVRRSRRALSPAELQSLFDVLQPEHVVVYQFMLLTGLRCEEAAELQWGDLRLTATNPFIQLRAKTTKSKRADVVPLQADLAVELAQQRTGASDGARVFQAGIPTIDQHKAYLAAAGIAWEDADGRRVDRHALRKTFGTMLSLSGAMPFETKELMRHVDMRTTMDLYTDRRAFDLSAPISRLALPRPTPPPVQPSAAQATGTIDPVAPTVAPRFGHVRESAPIGADDPSHADSPSDSIGAEVRSSARISETCPRWESNPHKASPENCDAESKNADLPTLHNTGSSARGSALPPELLELTTHWPTLLPIVRAQIMQLARGQRKEAH